DLPSPGSSGRRFDRHGGREREQRGRGRGRDSDEIRANVHLSYLLDRLRIEDPLLLLRACCNFLAPHSMVAGDCGYSIENPHSEALCNSLVCRGFLSRPVSRSTATSFGPAPFGLPKGFKCAKNSLIFSTTAVSSDGSHR